MPLLAVAAMLPSLFWDQDPGTSKMLKEQGIARLLVPPARVARWRAAGFDAVAFTPGPDVCGDAEVPKVQMRMNVASATGMPWIDGNGWRFMREPGRRWCYPAAEGAAALAAAEAYSYGVQAVVPATPGDLAEFARMLEFLRSIARPPLPALANIGVVDDGSDLTGEVLNLMTRRNLMYRVVRAPDPKLDLNVKPEDVGDPYEYALEVRRKLGDGKRLVRLYGSEVVIAQLTGNGSGARLHLLNYSRRPVMGLRVRVLGAWGRVSLSVFGRGSVGAADVGRLEGGTEFTVPEMGPYAVADLGK